MNRPHSAGDRMRCSLLLLGLWSASGLAANLQVNSTADGADAAPGDGLCETLPGNGQCTLRAAVQEANANGATGNAIALPAGTYLLTLPGASEDAAASGDLDITSNLAITGSDAETTVVDAGGIDRVFDIVGGNATLTRLTIRGGGNVQSGGGVQNTGVLALIDCIVENNGGDAAPVRLGAGIANLSVTALTRTLVRDNQAGAAGQSGAAGGGIHNLLGLSVTGSEILGNRAVGSGAIGGGVFTQEPAVLQIATTTLAANSAPAGGGIQVAGGQLLMSDSLFATNQSTGSGPGSGAGGALRISAGSATLVNVTLSGNLAKSNGGGLAVSGGSVALASVTVADNTADSAGSNSGHGGGVQVSSGAALTLRNSLIAGNHDNGSMPQPDCSGAYTSQGHVLLQTSTGCTPTPGAGDLIGVDPHLAPLADNGGPTFTHALAIPSIAIDAGNPDGCTGFNGAPLFTDQRGAARSSDGNADQVAVCDLGAFEADGDVLFEDGFEAP